MRPDRGKSTQPRVKRSDTLGYGHQTKIPRSPRFAILPRPCMAEPGEDRKRGGAGATVADAHPGCRSARWGRRSALGWVPRCPYGPTRLPFQGAAGYGLGCMQWGRMFIRPYDARPQGFRPWLSSAGPTARIKSGTPRAL